MSAKKFTTKESARPNLVEHLRDAIERNTSIGIVRLGHSGQDPLAQGRMLEWKDDTMVIEELQIIGRDVTLRSGDRIECYVSYRDIMMTFESKILTIEEPTRLNKARIVRSLQISNPAQLREGDRRSAFRASVSTLPDPIPVSVWLLDRFKSGDEPGFAEMGKGSNAYYTDLLAARRYKSLIPVDEDGIEPISFDWGPVVKHAVSEEPHAKARIIDLTVNGLGLLMYGISSMQLNRFERAVLSFELEGEKIQLVVEIRHGADLRGSTCKVGTLMVYPDGRSVGNTSRRTMERFAMQVQREQLKHRRIA